MADVKRSFTEDEHQLLLTERVSQETAALSSRLSVAESEKNGLQSKLDVVEAEKSSLESEKSALAAERDTIKAEFEKFKSDLEEKAQAEARRESRVADVKAKADHLPDEYFTAERAERWAAMADDVFEAAVADLVATRPEAAGAAPAAGVQHETAAFARGTTPKANEDFAVTRFLAVGRDA